MGKIRISYKLVIEKLIKYGNKRNFYIFHLKDGLGMEFTAYEG